jgi:DNA-binding MarR family transcriptional regulator
VAGMDRTAGERAATRLSDRELAVWRSLLETTADLRRLLSARMQESGCSPADYGVLLALHEAEGGRLRSSQLAAAIDWERSRLSHHLGRMERRGLIRRENSAADSRGAVVFLSDEGAAAFRRAGGPHLRAIKSHFAEALTDRQLAALDDALQALRAHLGEGGGQR